jgi:hypothetical protein
MKALTPGRASSLRHPTALLLGTILLSGSLLFETLPGAAESKNTQTKPVTTKETSLQRIQKMVAKLNAEASTPEGEEAVVNRLSKQLAVPPETLRQQQQMWGIGFGDVAMVYGFSRASRKKATPDEVVELRRSGKEWDAIGKEIGVNVDAVASRMKKNVNPKPPPATPK